MDLFNPSSTLSSNPDLSSDTPPSLSARLVAPGVVTSLPCLHPRTVCMLEVDEEAASDDSLVLILLGCHGGNPGRI